MLKTLLDSLREMVQWLIALRHIKTTSEELGREKERREQAEVDHEAEQRVAEVRSRPLPSLRDLREWMRRADEDDLHKNP